MGQYNEKWPISLVCVKTTDNYDNGYLGEEETSGQNTRTREREDSRREGSKFSALHSRGVSSESKFETTRSLNSARCPVKEYVLEPT